MSFLVLRIQSAHLFNISILIRLVLLIQNVQVREKNLTKLVVGHAIGWNTIFDRRNFRHIIEQVEHGEAEFNVRLRKLDALHDRRVVHVCCKDVASPSEIHHIKGLLRTPIHVLKVKAEGFLDTLREVVLALPVLVLIAMTVIF